MSTEQSSSLGSTPNLNLSPDEKRAYGQLFRQADTDGVGVVTGDVAVTFFDKTRLDSRVLGEIWQIADKENRGFLTPAGFGIVLRLIGHAQSGREPTPELALQRGPLPRFDGIQMAVGSPSPLQTQATGTGPLRIPPLTQDKVTQYAGLFERQALQGNLLPGEQARQIFDKSGLPNDTLGRIWALSDTEQRGSLVQAEFVIAMHLLTSMKSGALRGLPNMLPPGLYEAASGRPGAGSPRGSTLPAIPRQLSGTPQNRTGSPLGRSVGASDWPISPADKAKFDQLYNDLDQGNKGFITGEEAVPFFGKSKLSEDTLAQIWDLSDINSVGQLSRDEFAVAMHLIRVHRLGNPLPSTLPPNFIPPSMRNQARPPPAASPFAPPPAAAAPPQQPKSALDDLFGLDASGPAISAPTQLPMSTGGSAGDPFSGGTPTSPARAATLGPSTTFKPFVPSSSFGRGLATDSSSTQQQPSATEDLLADHNPEESRKITGESTELANLSNQIGSLSKEMQDVQGKRTLTQNELNQTNSQKQNFEQRLAQLRQLYEKEAKDTQNLEEQLQKSRNDTRNIQGECLTLEEKYRDIQQQNEQISAALQADQQENGSLRERIRIATAEISKLKPQIEKLKMEARQQKGLVAINKKQLTTTEGERDKLKTEAEDLYKGAATEEHSRQADPTSPVSTTPNRVASPTPSTSSGNNPFFRRTTSTDIMGVFAAATPQAKNAPDTSFDEVFGPSSSSTQQQQQPAAAAPFKPQLTGASTASSGSYNTPGSTPTVSRQATLRSDNQPPPPPPESRQISSSFLPFAEQSDSISSSRHVSPPASRVGEAQPTTLETSRENVSSSNASSETTEEDSDKVETAATAAAPVVASKEAATTKTGDVFGSTDDAKAKADFDNAFAAFSSSKGPKDASPSGSKPKSNFDTEFPPIADLEHDDESESDSEQGGFDDDFAPAVTHLSQKSAVPPVDAFAPPEVPAKEPINTTTAKSVEKPTSPAVISKVETTTTTTAAAAATAATAATTNKEATADDIFGAAAAATNSSKGTFDDLEDDFEGLEDAKEGSADDDFANISRSGLEDYNHVFDSSPPGSHTKSETAFGNESSFDFVQSNPVATTTGGGAGQSKTADTHDWDAIFAGLDEDAAADGSKDGKSKAQDGIESRPTGPGRALTDKGEHDDPILKNLTGMGYSRTDAVAALEKFNYNLEKAANYLASKS